MRTHLTFEDVRFTYDGSGNPVDMLDSVNELGYTYIYENGRLQSEMQTEDAKMSGEYRVPGRLVRRTQYSYDRDGRLSKKTRSAGTDTRTYRYTYTEDGEATVTLPTGAKTRSRTDALGRRSFDEITTANAVYSRRFEYTEGKLPDIYREI